MWSEERLILEKFFEIDEDRRGTQVALEVLDLAYLHQPSSQLSQDLIDALAEVSSDLKAIFKNKAIRSIMDSKWEITRKHVKLYQLYPYAA